MKLFKKGIALFTAVVMALTSMNIYIKNEVKAVEQPTDPYNISYGRPVYASSQAGTQDPEYAVDNDLNTRWQASNEDSDEWFYVDLGKEADIDHIFLKWETARAKSYIIQFSDDEENWRDVYKKGTNFGTESDIGMKISFNVNSIQNNKGTVQTEWTSVDNADYKVCIDNENNIATAPDGYQFASHFANGGQLSIPTGEHKIIVIAIDRTTKQEIGRGSTMIDVKINEDTDDSLEQTINLDNLSKDQKRAQYVRVKMTERSMIQYGCSLFEMQVWGDNGAVKRPPYYGENLALNKKVKCSDIRDEWWMYDENGNIKEDAIKDVKAENAVDGNAGTSFSSYQDNDQWIYVDLGQKYNVGRIVISWAADAAKVYDILISSDGKKWETVHRVTKGTAFKQDNFIIDQKDVRFVKVYGYTRVNNGGTFSIYELSVYKSEDTEKPEDYEQEPVGDLPQENIIYPEDGMGSYVTGQMYNEKSKVPAYINKDTVSGPIDTNSWWNSALINKFSNTICVTPLKTKIGAKGLGVLTATAGWVGERGENDLGTEQSCETSVDYYITPDEYRGATGYDRVEKWGDYSVKLGLCDANGLQMKTTLTKGSPYIYNEFCNNTKAFLSSTSITEVFDANGNTILKKKGDTTTTDHIGFKSYDDENIKAKNDGIYYCVSVPEGTRFTAVVVGQSTKIKIEFPSEKENYMSVASMTKKSDLDKYYKHGYAFIEDTKVDYNFDSSLNKVNTVFTATTKRMRNNFSDVSMQALFPHQWKCSNDASDPVAVYTSVRGDMKAIWANSFATTQQFGGILPTFARPDSEAFDSKACITYLKQVVSSKMNTAPSADAYWEGKNIHPLAISALMADQLGETKIKNQLLGKLKKILTDWFNYDGEGDRCYFLYNKDWGTIYFPDSGYGANEAISDHHFTYGYYMFGAAVLASFDQEFKEDYKDMIELLVRDYANPSEPKDDDNMFCKFRNFDQYAGHSWAGGYSDNDSGNNQESASESLFSWVGMYLWGEASGNQKYIDAGAYGFTTEMEAVKQYWFDYDEDNWLDDYPFQGTGQVYGGVNFFGTFFGGQPVYVYGIQWLPISEYLTYYGMDQTKCAKIYQGMVDDTQYAINIEKRKGAITDDDQYVTPDNSWQHIMWPFLSQTNPELALEKFNNNTSKVQVEDRANTLWFLAAMDQIGYRTNNYIVTGNIGGSVYVKNNKYTAEVWNPTNTVQTVTIKKANGTIAGTAEIAAGSTLSFNIDTTKQFAYKQLSKPTMKATALVEGTVRKKLKESETFDNTQLIEISNKESDAKIYYTTDGSVPTTKSKLYDGKILVSSDTVIKALAVKDGFINSSYTASSITIDGDVVASDENLALGKTVTASSGEGPDRVADGNYYNRWQAGNTDDEWIMVDIGYTASINTVSIKWEAAFAKDYKIQVSKDGDNWTTVATEEGEEGTITSKFSAVRGRYVRMLGVERAIGYGYSIYEMEVYGANQPDAPIITPISGTYDGQQTVTMSTTAKGAEIKYTLDGSEPNEDSKTYTQPITVDNSTMVKAVTYRKGMILSGVSESNIVVKNTVSLNKKSAIIAKNNSVNLQALTDGVVQWSSDKTSVATVDVNGKVTGINIGEATITARIASGASATCKVTIVAPVALNNISFKTNNMTMRNKTSETLDLVINPSNTTDNTDATWKSSNEDVASVDSDGTVTALKEGKTVITATIGAKKATMEINVIAAATLKEMLMREKFNVAFKKKCDVYPGIYEGSADCITDGALSAGADHAALGTGWGYENESSVVIDLGDYYDRSSINQVVVQYKDASPDDTVLNKKYEILYSTNGVEYESVYKSDNVNSFDENLCTVTDVSGKTGAVRFVKIAYPKTAFYGTQICEVGVLSLTGEAKPISVAKSEKPKDVVVTSPKEGKINVSIDATKTQTGYKYMVYLDDYKIRDQIGAGSLDIDATPGKHEVTVVSYYDGKLSDPVTCEINVEDPSLKKYIKTTRNLTLGSKVTVDSIEREHQEGNRRAATLVDGIISYDTWNVVETKWGNKTATIDIELPQECANNQIDEMLMSFKGDITNATDYKVEFSNDGTNYETVLNKTGVAYSSVIEDKLDLSSYSQDGVSYIRVTLLGGNYNYGYQISEIALMGTEDLNPPETTTVERTSRVRPTTTEADDDDEDDTTTSSTTKPSGSDSTATSAKETASTKTIITSSNANIAKTKVKRAVKRRSTKKLSVTLKKVRGVNGYQVAVYKTKKAKKALYKKFVKKYKFMLKSKKLKNRKTLFVRARTYILVYGTKVYGKWSAKKKVKFIKK